MNGLLQMLLLVAVLAVPASSYVPGAPSSRALQTKLRRATGEVSKPLQRQPLFAKDSTKTDGGARQLMGIKGASENTNKWAIRLQLCKPVTWIPLIWGVACGAAASGNYHTWNPFGGPDAPPLDLVALDAAKAFACMFLSGPILTGAVADPFLFAFILSFNWAMT